MEVQQLLLKKKAGCNIVELLFKENGVWISESYVVMILQDKVIEFTKLTRKLSEERCLYQDDQYISYEEVYDENQQMWIIEQKSELTVANILFAETSWY